MSIVHVHMSPFGLTIGIIEAVRQLRHYEMREVMKERDVPDFLEHARWFAATFTELREIMKLKDSTYNRPSSGDSGGSGDSRDEDNIKGLSKALMRDALYSVGQSIQVLSWNQDLKLDVTYNLVGCSFNFALEAR